MSETVTLYGLFYTLPGEFPVEVPWPRVGPKLYGDAHDLVPALKQLHRRGLAARIREVTITPRTAPVKVQYGQISLERLAEWTGWGDDTIADVAVVADVLGKIKAEYD